MNIPPREALHVPVDDLRTLCTTLFQRAGVPPADADLITDLLIDTDLRGVLSHGTQTVNGYCRSFLNGSLNPTPTVQVIAETATTVLVDGDGGLGHLAAQRMTEAVIAKAKAQGIAAGTTRYHGHFGSAGKYVRQALRQGCVAWCVSGYDVQPAPGSPLWGSLGNPPLCFGVPGGEGPPMIVDMGAIFFFDPPETLAEGFTRNPAAYFKCLGLAATAHLWGGLLAGTTQPGYSAAERRFPGAVYGSFLSALDVARFVPLESFQAEVDRLLTAVGQLQPMPGYDRAYLPGGLEWEHEQEWSQRGIPLGPAHQRALEALAAELGVAVPWG
jgi:LDH2 family malate/lactate/ureidoglycolate dehydrogenase